MKWILLLFVTILASSCSKWFDVQPSSEIKDSELFSTDKGFYRAVMGVYIGLTDPALYGRDYNMGITEILSQTFSLKASFHSRYYPYLDYQFNEQYAKPAYEGMFAKAYNILANVNYILENIKGKRDLFPPHNYELIVAEMKAVRAYLHFDLLRLYAPSIAVGGMQAPAVPYADRMLRGAQPQLTTGEILTAIKQDLNEAADSLLTHDPYFTLSGAGGETIYIPENAKIKDQGFSYSRKTRLNYYAINGLLARIALYEADYEQALYYSKLVINSNKFKLTNTGSQDPVFQAEILFYLTNINLEIDSKELFSDYSVQFTISDDNKRKLFEEEKFGITDNRYLYQFSSRKDETGIFLNKYYGVYYNYIPMIRISEMNYIASEASFKLTDKTSAVAYLNAVRTARIAKKPENTIKITDLDIPGFDFQNEIYKEYQKEFLGEGQLFHYLKRLNIQEFKGINGKVIKVTDYPSVYVLPIPDREIEYGYIK